MNVFFDMNVMYDAATEAMKSSKFKTNTQLFEINQLLRCAEICQSMRDGTYRPNPGRRFPINERGKVRYITSNTMEDKTVNHVLCDKVLTPATQKYLIHNNGASQKGKGVSFHRRELEKALHRYYMQTGSNEGYILLADYSGFYPNIRHKECKEILFSFIDRGGIDQETAETAKAIITAILKTFEMDVSRFTDEEIAAMMAGKADPMLNVGVPPDLLTGEKMLQKGIDIGSQPSQNVGIVFPYRIDNLAKIVFGFPDYGRYTDDFWAIDQSKERLLRFLEAAEEASNGQGLILNRKKTHIAKLSTGFTHLQTHYVLTESGKVEKKVRKKNVSREREKLRAYKRRMEAGEIPYTTVENSFKSWMGGNWQNMSHRRIYNITQLYFELFGRIPTWKRKHGRLHWLMVHPPKDWAKTETTISAKKS